MNDSEDLAYYPNSDSVEDIRAQQLPPSAHRSTRSRTRMASEVSSSSSAAPRRPARAAKINASAKLLEDPTKFGELVKDIKSSKELRTDSHGSGKRSHDDISVEEVDGGIFEGEGSRGSTAARIEADLNRHKRFLNEDHETIDRLRKMVELASAAAAKKQRSENPPMPEVGMQFSEFQRFSVAIAELTQNLARERERSEMLRTSLLKTRERLREVTIPQCSTCLNYSCTLLLHPAASSASSHYSCTSCYMRLAASEKPKCPLCREQLGTPTFVPGLVKLVASDSVTEVPKPLRPDSSDLNGNERKRLMTKLLANLMNYHDLPEDTRRRLENHYSTQAVYRHDTDDLLRELEPIPERLVSDQDEAPPSVDSPMYQDE